MRAIVKVFYARDYGARDIVLVTFVSEYVQKQVIVSLHVREHVQIPHSQLLTVTYDPNIHT